MQSVALPIFLLLGCLLVVGGGLLAVGMVLGPRRAGQVKRMPYESGMDPVHDTRRRFDVRFHLLAIAFLVFDVELLFLYPWAVVVRGDLHATTLAEECPTTAEETAITPSFPATSGMGARPAFLGGMVFIAILSIGFIYDWKKGVLGWR